VVFFPSAKKEGMLHYFADSAQEKVVKIVLFLELLCCVGVMLGLSLTTGILTVAVAFLSFGYYRWRTNRELGGITGDTAGYFVTVCEAVIAIAAAVGTYLQ
jgi:adenosylcobinamide-GDP ribazoletransferase